MSSFTITPDTLKLFRFHLNLEGISLNKLAADLRVRPIAVSKLFTMKADADLLVEAFTLTRFDANKLSLAEADALEKVAKEWNDGHGAFLSERFSALGFDSRSFSGASHASLTRWFQASLRPRPVALAPVLRTLGISATELLEIEGARAGENVSRFTYALRALKEDLGYSNYDMAHHLKVSGPTLQAWLDGRGFPKGSIRKRLEYALGVTVDEARSESRRAAEEHMPTSKLGRLIHAQRHAKNLSLEELADRAGVGKSALVNLEEKVEYGSRGFENLRRVADALDLGYDEIALALYGPLPRDTFAQRLRFERVTRLISTAEMADRLGIAHFVYFRYESGDSDGAIQFPGRTAGRLEAIMDVLGVGPEQLFNPDKKAFQSWLASEIETHGMTMISLLSGVGESTVNGWLTSDKRPTFRQAGDLSRFCGYPKGFARVLITG